MGMPGTVGKILILIVLLVSFAGNIIALAGIAKLTDICNDQTYTFPLAQFPGSNIAYDCGIHFSLNWWLVCYQLFISLWAVLGSFIACLHSKSFILWTFAISTTLWSTFAYEYIRASYVVQDVENGYANGVKAAAAGAVTTLVANYLFAFIFGMGDDKPNPAPAADPVKA